MRPGKTKRAKVCFLVRKLDFGGAERQLVALAKALPAERCEIAVIEFYSGGALSAELTGHAVRRICLHKRGRWDLYRFLRSLIAALRAFDPDVIHGYLYVPNILAVAVKPFLRRNTKTVLGLRSAHCHLEHYDWTYSAAAWLERQAARWADLIIANSRAGRAYAARAGFPAEKLLVIRNGIDARAFYHSAAEGRAQRGQWGFGTDSLIIGLVGRLDPKKNHMLFIEAAALYAQRNPVARFVCVGGAGAPGYRDELRAAVRRFGLAGRLIFSPAQSNMRAVYNAFDVNTMCSNDAEGFPNVLGEAMACGIPCVATASGDARDIVGDHGVIIAARDARELCRGWERCLEVRAAQPPECIRAHVVEHFSVERLAAETLSALTALLVSGDPLRQAPPARTTAGSL